MIGLKAPYILFHHRQLKALHSFQSRILLQSESRAENVSYITFSAIAEANGN